ncbi:hypothetical protein [Flavobacterium collinsii]|uniref:Uncharacterized protein n=1 Tax=Flavobacterium collinsii TaxID=1114861 RepID=A0ABN7EMQ0_9FLAO|nr:hypothetical protein [Flavobacterium collinsii]CAA9198686.1 hypothetical protein FLACOL7796_02272 [Flavobacterium collinsii]
MDVSFFSSTIVQVAISLVISWALFALLCSMILETTVQIKSERGRFFRNKIVEKLFDYSNQINWGLLMYNNSNIRLLTKSEKAPPTEITSKTLAEVLIDTVANAQAAKILLQDHKENNIIRYDNDLLNNFEFAITYLGQSDLIMMLKNALNKAKIKATEPGDRVVEKTLYEELVKEVTIWFDQFSDRTSVWYKKLSRKRLFIIGLLVSGIINIDSIVLFKYYDSNPTARAGMIDYYSKNREQLEVLSAKYSTAGQNSAVDQASIELTKKDIKDLTKQIDSLRTNLDLPIGWNKAVCTDTKNTSGQDRFTLSCILLKLLGIIISAFVASLGAPFWFDVLKKATSTAQTVTKVV